jgi:membrane-bound lytic murein transglycosylase B
VAYLLARLWIVVVLVAVLASAGNAGARPPTSSSPSSYAARTEVKHYIEQLVDAYGFDRTELKRTFREARYQRSIIVAMERPLLAPPKWYDYAPPFLSSARVLAGADYWNANQESLARAESAYGVPAEIIVAILGIETYYGRMSGGYRALDALTTLAFDYPRRAVFFRGELTQFLLLARELGVSPSALKGSFAGALGVPQFMPGSYRNYAVDADGNGRADLWASPADIAGSVANFLARHDWQPGQPVLLGATIATEARDTVLARLDGGLSERRSVEAWAADGVAIVDPPSDLAPDPVGLLLLEEKSAAGDDASYWIACNNFYVLTRYNRSRLYAAAVWHLAKAIKAARTEIVR